MNEILPVSDCHSPKHSGGPNCYAGLIKRLIKKEILCDSWCNFMNEILPFSDCHSPKHSDGPNCHARLIKRLIKNEILYESWCNFMNEIHPVSDCHSPKHSGGPHCYAHLTRWYYNKHSGQCLWFFYRGCGGNRNRYNTRAECLAKCKPKPKYGK